MLVDLTSIKELYFEPDSDHKLKYPCLIYKRVPTPRHANDNVYVYQTVYDVQLIESEFESERFHKMFSIPRCIYDRTFKKDGLYHHNFTIHY